MLAAERPSYEYLDTQSATFARYLKVRANRHDDFYIRPAGGVDLCNVQVPVRKKG
jgi:peptidylprolyl isomerase